MTHINRHYSGISDSGMLKGMQTMKDLFADDLQEFTVFDPAFDEAFAISWQAALDAGKREPSDEVVMDQVQQRTSVVETAAAKCRAAYVELKFFVSKAFPEDEGARNEFGFDDYQLVSNAEDLVIFMTNAHRAALVKKDRLLAVNYDEAKIDALDALQEALHKASREQAQALQRRGEGTQGRVEIMNAAWDPGVKVSAASKLIYAKNPAKYNQYLLPAAGSNERPPSVSITGAVTSQATGSPVAGATLTLQPGGSETRRTTRVTSPSVSFLRGPRRWRSPHRVTKQSLKRWITKANRLR